MPIKLLLRDSHVKMSSIAIPICPGKSKCHIMREIGRINTNENCLIFPFNLLTVLPSPKVWMHICNYPFISACVVCTAFFINFSFYILPLKVIILEEVRVVRCLIALFYIQKKDKLKQKIYLIYL